MDFQIPTEFGEQLAFGGACLSALFGLLLMIVPGIARPLTGLARDSQSSVRSSGGMMLGLGLSAILLAQPLIYLALAAAFAMAAVGRFLSILLDRGAPKFQILSLVVLMLMACLPALYVFGIV